VRSIDRLLEALPPPYAVAADSVVYQVLNAFALEMEAFAEDLDRVRQSHWIDTAYRLADLEKLAALVDVERMPWESPRLFKGRVISLVRARLAGAVGRSDLEQFVYEYLRAAELAAGATLVPGLSSLDQTGAFAVPADRPLYRPLCLIENPLRQRRSAGLLLAGHRVRHLSRWTEANRGLEPAAPTFFLTGLPGHKTACPVLCCVTSGDLLGYAGVVPAGRTLRIEAGDGPLARASIDGHDVSARLYSVSGFQLGKPFSRDEMHRPAALPILPRGPSEWRYFSIGLFDLRALDTFYFAVPDETTRQGAFDESGFDQALFSTEPAAQLEMTWQEVEPASFEVQIPRYLVIEGDNPAAEGDPSLPDAVLGAIADGVGALHAAGVRAVVKAVPFVETMPMSDRVQPSWLQIDPERGSAGTRDRLRIGASFGQGQLGGSLFN
jgi:hypothetical protein